MGIRLTTKRQRNQAEENWKTSNIERSTSVFEAITLILARQQSWTAPALWRFQ
jgi:hypothetical protein